MSYWRHLPTRMFITYNILIFIVIYVENNTISLLKQENKIKVRKNDGKLVFLEKLFSFLFTNYKWRAGNDLNESYPIKTTHLSMALTALHSKINARGQ